MIIPRIADVRCQHIRFQPGDRVLVRCVHRLEPEQVRRLKRSIQRWAGTDVEILIYSPLDFNLEIEHHGNTVG